MRVLATARTAEAIQDLADLGMETLSLEVDNLKSINVCKEVVKERTGGRLDYLINNAGRSEQVSYKWFSKTYSQYTDYAVPAIEADFSEMESVFATNFFAVVRLCQSFMPLLRRSRGTIVQIGSVAGCFPYAWGSIYNASKAALHSYSEALRIEVAPLGVHVITVVTGGVKSRIARVKRSLPEDSAYKELEDHYQKRQIQSQTLGMETAIYAKKVVKKILEAEGWLWRTKTIWVGGGSGITRWLSRMLPQTVSEWVISRMFGFSKIQGAEGEKERT